ncbi:hypothetical protein M758_12G170300 [Ceratodon purpureus]|nr:hypothetical protein M758_12G170300 [Ceratodon purpureus]
MFDQRPARGLSSTRAWSAGPATYPYSHAPAKAVKTEAQGAEEREMSALRELLAAFPVFSLEDIAQAYTEADSDVNAAAELLTTRQPTVKSNGGGVARRNLGAERNSNGIRRQSAEQPVVGSDDLLMEKYGMRVGEIINRDCPKQSKSLFHNMQSAHGGGSSRPHQLKSPTQHGARWDTGAWGGEVMNNEGSNGVSGDGALLVGRKKTKQKGRGGLENEVERADATASREADEKLLLSVLGEDFQLGIGVVRDVLDSFNGDTQKSIEVLLQMASSTSPKSPKLNLTNTHDGWYFDDKDVRTHSSHQLTKIHVDNASMQNAMEQQRLHDDFWKNGPDMVPRAGDTANSYTHQTSKTDQDHLKIWLSLNELKAIFPHVDDRYLHEVMQSNNFVLSDAVQFLLDATADKRSTNSSAGSKVDQGNHSNICKTSVHKDSSDSLVTTRPPPLRASWADVKPKIIPLKQNLPDVSSKRGLWEKTSEGKNEMSQLKSPGDFDDYGRQRQSAQDHWRMMDYYFKEAAAAYDRGERCRAVTLAEKGKEQKQLAQQADERASQRIFHAKNKDIVNNITIDLHAQHVREAMNVLKRHLQTLCSIPSVDMLTVITGYGSHSSNGRARIKPAVTGFLSRSGISWDDVNEGCLTIKMKDVRNKKLEMCDGD